MFVAGKKRPNSFSIGQFIPIGRRVMEMKEKHDFEVCKNNPS